MGRSKGSNKGGSKGSDVPKTWADVKNTTLKQLESKLDEADTANAQNDVLSNFKCELTKFKGVSLQAIVRTHPYEMQRAWFSLSPDPMYPPTIGQPHLAIHVYKLLQLMDIDCKYVPKKIKDLVGEVPELPPIEDWAEVQNQALKEVHTRLDEAIGIVEGDPDLLGFKCQLKDFPFDLATMLKQYPVRIDTAFYAHRPGRPSPPTASQKHFVDAMCKLMGQMGIVPEGMAAPQEALPEDEWEAGMAQKRDPGWIIYLVVVKDALFFKLGQHHLELHPKINPEGPAVKDRFHRGPPKYMPRGLKWANDKLILHKMIYVTEAWHQDCKDQKVDIDEPIHAILHAAAAKYNLPDTGKQEFHHLGLLSMAMHLMDKAVPQSDAQVQNGKRGNSVVNASFCKKVRRE